MHTFEESEATLVDTAPIIYVFQGVCDVHLRPLLSFGFPSLKTFLQLSVKGGFGGALNFIGVCAGRHEFFKASFCCRDCGNVQVQTTLEFLQMPAWPGTPDPSKAQTYIDERELKNWEYMKGCNPGASMEGFLKALARKLRDYGGEVGAISYFSYQRIHAWPCLQHLISYNIVVIKNCPHT